MARLSTHTTVSTALLLGLALCATGAQAQQSADKAIVAAVDGVTPQSHPAIWARWKRFGHRSPTSCSRTRETKPRSMVRTP